MSNILVVYFSRTGYTKRVAEQLAQKLDSAICPIEEERPRRGVRGYARCLLEVALDIDPRIKPVACDPGQFDLVIIGTPIWGSHLASPPRAFVRRYDMQIKRTAFFCTMGGSGAETAFGQLQQTLGTAPVATLALTDREIDANAVEAKLTSFAAALQDNVHGARPTVPSAGGMHPVHA